jgi:hypothetical protein
MNYRTWYNERNITKQYRTITMIEIRKLSKDSYYAFAQANHALQQPTNGDKNWQREEEGERSEERRKIWFRRCQIEVNGFSPIQWIFMKKHQTFKVHFFPNSDLRFKYFSCAFMNFHEKISNFQCSLFSQYRCEIKVLFMRFHEFSWKFINF